MKKTPDALNIYLLEPFYSGSHKLWVDQIIEFSRHHVSCFTMPARFWKWRMKGSALHLTEKINKISRPDLFLISDMIDLPLFKALCRYKDVPVILYMHENQFAYPERTEKDFTYAFLNYSSCLVADEIWWNSDYNLTTFLTGATDLLRRLPDYTDSSSLEKMRIKSSVVYPGLYPDLKSNEGGTPRNGIPVLLWNHRREHDKGPELFFEALFRLKEEKLAFHLIVLGESYDSSPPIFAEARNRLKDEIIYMGYAESREEYLHFLRMSDILPVTSCHDFFGISVWEAVSQDISDIARCAFLS